MAAVNVTFPGNLGQVADIPSLRALPSSRLVNEQPIIVGKVGIFTFDASSLQADNGSTTIKPNDLTSLQAGRWVALFVGGGGGEGPTIDLANLRNQEVHASYDAANPLQHGMRVDTVSTARRVDGIFGYSEFYGALSAGYPFHGIAYADTGVLPGAVGGGGFAIGGPGTGSGVIGNRREAGAGNGVTGTRDGTGAGHGVTGTAQGTGDQYQAGVQALKQNVNGQPGGASSPGAALAAINFADQGRAIESTTLENNQDGVSNFYERRNVTFGAVSRKAILLGGARTGALVVDDILVQPATPLTGSYPITGTQVIIRDKVVGANEATAFSASNEATGGASAYGVVGVVLGANTNNAGGRFSASGGTNNYSIDCAVGVALFRDGIQALNLPVYADNAAAAAAGLAVGRMYRTADGTVKVAFAV